MCQPCALNQWLTTVTAPHGSHLAQVPIEKDMSIADQLQAALDATGVSQAELARRLARMDGKTAGGKRRGLLKILGNPDYIPRRKSLVAIEVALELEAGYFKPPHRDATRDRRARLEVEVADLTVGLAAAKTSHERLRKRVATQAKQIAQLQQDVRLLLLSRPEGPATHLEQSGP